MKTKTLVNELNNWFNKINRNNKRSKRNFWGNNLVAKVIKTNLIKWDNWKRRGKDYIDI